MTKLEYPCGCKYDIFTWEDEGYFDFQIDDDGYMIELCEEHQKELISKSK